MTQLRSPARTLLIVEDDPDTREYLELLLTAAGYAVHSAPNGAAGFRLSAAHHVDAAFVDRRLPDMDGLALARVLVERWGPSVPLVLMSADRDPRLKADALNAGARAFLAKPFLPDALLELLASFFEPYPA